MIKTTKITIVGLVILCILFLFVGIVYLRFQMNNSPSTNPSASDSNFPTTSPLTELNPIKRSVIGVTTDQQIESTYQILSTSINERGGTEYKISSIWNSRPHMIETTEGTASFERALAPLNPNEPGFSKISDYISTMGEAEEVLKGSRYYGSFASIYLYPAQGFAFTGNANTDEIYEFQYFKPITLEEYKILYGQDIDTAPQEHKFDPIN